MILLRVLAFFPMQAECWKEFGQHIQLQHCREVLFTRRRGERSDAMMKLCAPLHWVSLSCPLYLCKPLLKSLLASFISWNGQRANTSPDAAGSETCHGCPTWKMSSLFTPAERHQMPSWASPRTHQDNFPIY